MFNKPIFSVNDVAYLLGIPKWLVYKMINLGKLKASMKSRIDGYKITKEDFKEYCEEREVNFDDILEKYYKKNGIEIDKEKVSPQDDNSILGYPPHPYNPGYRSPNMYYDPVYTPNNRDKLEVCNHKGPKDPKNPHNSLYTTGEIGLFFGIDTFSFYMLLDKLGYIYKTEGAWKAVNPLIRFGLVKYDIKQNALLWTYIGKNFLEDQLLFEIGFEYTASEKNKALVQKLLAIYN